jgi:hypothetical protein
MVVEAEWDIEIEWNISPGGKTRCRITNQNCVGEEDRRTNSSSKCSWRPNPNRGKLKGKKRNGAISITF